ncbi:MAG: phosphotransferase family protein [Proteobacteria bacterium]|nr:phosphotransferase family protein [Pseudomonadota bacterium]
MNTAAGLAPPAAALVRVPGLESGDAPLRVERLTGGIVNDSWRVDTARGRFVLRIAGPVAQRPGVERGRERTLHEFAAQAGFAPRALLWDDAAGVQVREFIDGRVWGERDLEDTPQLRRLGGRLAQLHALPAPAGVASFDPADSARQYLRLIEAAGQSTAVAAAIAAAVRRAAEFVAARAARRRVIHGDLGFANLLDGERLWLLDWEYAQVADPVYDVACLLAYCPAARPQAAVLLEAAGLGATAEDGTLAESIRVYEGLTWLWHRARGTGIRAP